MEVLVLVKKKKYDIFMTEMIVENGQKKKKLLNVMLILLIKV